MTIKTISRRRFIHFFTLSIAALSVPTTSTAGDFRYQEEAQSDWPKNLVRAVQQRLKDRGHDPGPIDGLYGAMTRFAIQQFQNANNIDVDGLITNSLLKELGLE